jgi:hypothetical protein
MVGYAESSSSLSPQLISSSLSSLYLSSFGLTLTSFWLARTTAGFFFAGVLTPFRLSALASGSSLRLGESGLVDAVAVAVSSFV